MASFLVDHPNGFDASNRTSAIEFDIVGVGRGLDDRYGQTPFVQQPSDAVATLPGGELQQQVTSFLQVPKILSSHRTRSECVLYPADPENTHGLSGRSTTHGAGAPRTSASQPRTQARPSSTISRRAASYSGRTGRGSDQHPKQMCELPDLFYAHNPARYSSYKGDCSLAYHSFHSFIRHSLEKHWNRGNVEREGISDDQFLTACGNFVTRNKPLSQHDKERHRWKSARQALFGTPMSAPIPDCGRHNVVKSKATKQEKKYKARPIPEFESVAQDSQVLQFGNVATDRQQSDTNAGLQFDAASPITTTDFDPSVSSHLHYLVPDPSQPAFITHSVDGSTQPYWSTSLLPESNQETELATLFENVHNTVEVLKRMYPSTNYSNYCGRFHEILQVARRGMDELYRDITNSNTFLHPPPSDIHAAFGTPSSPGTSTDNFGHYPYSNYGGYLAPRAASFNGNSSSEWS